MLNKEYFNLFEIVTTAFQTVQHTASLRNIRLQLSFNKINPFILQQVYSDKLRLLQVLHNFLGNSLKFTRTNGHVTVNLIVLEEQNCEDLN